MQSRSPSALPAIVLAAALSAPAAAQCATGWLSGNGLQGFMLVNVLVARANGELLAAAWDVNYHSQVMRWSGAAWTALGPAMNGQIQAMLELPNGEIVAGGYFTMVGSTPAFGLARWDGTSWSSPGGTNGYVEALALLPNGHLVAAGNFGIVGGVTVDRVAVWDGTTWSSLGSQGRTPGVTALTALPNGHVVASGWFSFGGQPALNGVALWNGTAWSPIGSFYGGVYTLQTLPNGNVAAGLYQGFALWNGTHWTYPTAGGMDSVFAFASLPDGDLVTGGRFTSIGLGSVNRIARWHDTNWSPASWSPIGTGMNSDVRSLAMLPNGQMVAGGVFTEVDGLPQPRVAFLASNCAAAATVGGAGCAGSAGPNTLKAASLPWTGSTFRGRATGMTNNALALSLFGLSAVSLPQPLGLPGCWLHVSADAIQLLLPVGGSVDTHLPIPDSVAFAGLVLHHQVLAAELDAQNGFLAATGTNSLVLTVGTF